MTKRKMTRREFIQTTTVAGVSTVMGIPFLGDTSKEFAQQQGKIPLEHLDGEIPILFFPVKVETRFRLLQNQMADKKEQEALLVRFFPDEIAYTNIYEPITKKEQEAGKTFWKRMKEIEDSMPTFYLHAWEEYQRQSNGKSVNYEEIRKKVVEAQSFEFLKNSDTLLFDYFMSVRNIDGLVEQNRLAAWTSLAKFYGHGRAGWIANCTHKSYAKSIITKVDEKAIHGAFTKILPTAFTVTIFDKDWKESISFTGNSIKSLNVSGVIKLQPNLNKDDVTTIKKDGNNLNFKGEVEWVQKFDKACESGMAMAIKIKDNKIVGSKIDILTGINIVVAGVKAFSNEDKSKISFEAESKILVEELFKSHHYSNEGIELLKYGTATNNTEGENSYYDSRNKNFELSYRAHIDPLIRGLQTNTNKDKFDQYFDSELLDKALGLSSKITYQGWQNTEYMDASRIISQNIVDNNTDDKSIFYSHRNNNGNGICITGRGSLPPIRVGDQPYGILPIGNRDENANSLLENTIKSIIKNQSTNEQDIKSNTDKGFKKLINQTPVSYSIKKIELEGKIKDLRNNPELNLSEIDLQGVVLGGVKNRTNSEIIRMVQEMFDVAAYRADALENHLLEKRLYANREKKKTGLYIGNYAWVEDLKPNTNIKEVEKKQVHQDLQNLKIYDDLKDGGFIHAPSNAQAVAAAILRTAYLKNDNSKEPNIDKFEINLTSERVRDAYRIISAIQSGMTLAEVLGYQFERGLHDVGLHRYIQSFREKYRGGDNIIKGSNEKDIFMSVLNGESLAKDSPANVMNIFMKDLPNGEKPNGNEIQLFQKEYDKILNVKDALGDLTIAEGIYQSVLNNTEASGSALKNINEGKYPHQFEFMQTPQTGSQITHKVMLLLNKTEPVEYKDNNIRAYLEPEIDNWLTTILGTPSELLKDFSIVFKTKSLSDVVVFKSEMEDMIKKLRTIDLFYLLSDVRILNSKENNKLFNVLKYAASKIAYQKVIDFRFYDTTSIEIYCNHTPVYKKFSLICQLRNILSKGRALDSEDFISNDSLKQNYQLQQLKEYRNHLKTFDKFHKSILEKSNEIEDIINNNATNKSNVQVPFHEQNISYSDLKKIQSHLEFFNYLHFDSVLPYLYSNIDYEDYVEIQEIAKMDDEKAYSLSSKKRNFRKVLRSTSLQSATSFTNIYDTQPVSVKNIDDQKSIEKNSYEYINLLTKASALLKTLKSKELECYNLKSQFETIIQQSNISEMMLLKKEIAFFEDAFKVYLGKEFVFIPKCSVIEVQMNALKKFQILDYINIKLTLPNPQTSMNKWLAGLSKVRPNMKSLELAQTIDGALNTKDNLKCYPVQTNDRFSGSILPDNSLNESNNEGKWVGMDFIQQPRSGTNKLPSKDYTSILFVHNMPKEIPDLSKSSKGILIDEWTEMIPNKTETTAIAFNYDQPNNEPGQALLLAIADKTWNWEKIITNLKETFTERVKTRHWMCDEVWLNNVQNKEILTLGEIVTNLKIEPKSK
jgi:hypothetical protein